MGSSDALRTVADGLFAVKPKLVRLADGALLALERKTADAARTVMGRVSRDHGDSWSEAEPLLSLEGLPEGLQGVSEALMDRDGELHLFSLDVWYPDEAGEGERAGVGGFKNRRIDIWHVRSADGRTRWPAPRCIWEGYTGALNAVIQLRDGRIVLPFSRYAPRTWRERGGGLSAFTFTGMFDAVTLVSDDAGQSWELSEPLSVVTPNITHAYGAVEPVVLELRDGRVWMLIRTQLGRLYESFSADGLQWSRPRPSRFTSSDSPAGLVRLDDGRIVLLWNNCQRYPYAYGGRQVLHAAISADEGVSWHGYREVARDPQRHLPPPPHGDHGTAYPYPVATGDGAVIICTGQGEGRQQLVRLDPAWLLADEAEAAPEDWLTFGTRGASREGEHLRLQRVDSVFPVAAVWNLPLSRRGRVRLRLQAEPGQEGVRLALTDHFSTPFDEEAELYSVFLSAPLQLGGEREHVFVLEWDVETRLGSVRLNGEVVGELPLRHETEGICYLRVHPQATGPEAGALSVLEASWSSEG